MGLFRGKKMTLLFGGAIGAALAYFFDPDRGRGRRTRTLRPPRTTSLLTVPAREAWRSAT